MRRSETAWDSPFIVPVLCALLMLAGCGTQPSPTPPQPAPDKSADAAPTDSPTEAPAREKHPDSGTKWVGDIPYDVFYDQPLVVAADATSLAPSIDTPDQPTSTPPMPVGESFPQPEPPAAPTSGDGPDWTQLVAVDVLNDAVTRLRNSLTTNLNTLATYNRNIDEIAGDGASLAALAAVAEVHPDDVNWKENARYVRDLGYQIWQNATGTGRESFEATRLPFEQIVGILNGGPPPDISADDKVPFADIADRTELMKRIKQSYDFLRAEINTADRFKESPEDVIREASVLASFGGILSDESYDYADEEKYQQFIADFMKANVDVVRATESDNFAGFETARNRIQQACDACHAEYAFGGDDF